MIIRYTLDVYVPDEKMAELLHFDEFEAGDKLLFDAVLETPYATLEERNGSSTEVWVGNTKYDTIQMAVVKEAK